MSQSYKVEPLTFKWAGDTFWLKGKGRVYFGQVSRLFWNNNELIGQTFIIAGLPKVVAAVEHYATMPPWGGPKETIGLLIDESFSTLTTGVQDAYHHIR